MQNTGGSPLDWYNSIPPITRYYGTAVLFIALCQTLRLFSVGYYILSWPLVFQKQQLWRLVTDHFVLNYGKLGLNFLFDMVYLLQYGPRLEKQVYFADPSKFLYMLLFAIGIMDIISLVAELLMGFSIMSMGGSIIFMIMYVYCRENPHQQVSVWGVINVGQMYLPFVMVVLGLVMGGNWVEDVIGLVVGHIWWFLDSVYGPQTGIDYLKTPKFIQYIYYQYIAPQNQPQPQQQTFRAQQQQPQQSQRTEGFTAFQGRGYRVG